MRAKLINVGLRWLRITLICRRTRKLDSSKVNVNSADQSVLPETSAHLLQYNNINTNNSHIYVAL